MRASPVVFMMCLVLLLQGATASDEAVDSRRAAHLNTLPATAISRLLGTAPIAATPLTMAYTRNGASGASCPAVCFSAPVGPSFAVVAGDARSLLSPTGSRQLASEQPTVDTSRSCFSGMALSSAVNASSCAGLCQAAARSNPSQCFFDGSQTPRFFDNRTVLSALREHDARASDLLSTYNALRVLYADVAAMADLVASAEGALDDADQAESVRASIASISDRVASLAAEGSELALRVRGLINASNICATTSLASPLLDTAMLDNANLADDGGIRPERSSAVVAMHARLLCAMSEVSSDFVSRLTSFTDPLLNAANLSDAQQLRTALASSSAVPHSALTQFEDAAASLRSQLEVSLPSNATTSLREYVTCMSVTYGAWLQSALPTTVADGSPARCFFGAARAWELDMSAGTPPVREVPVANAFGWVVNWTAADHDVVHSASDRTASFTATMESVGALRILGFTSDANPLTDGLAIRLFGASHVLRNESTATPLVNQPTFSESPAPFFAPASGKCPVGTKRVREAATGLFQCEECRHEAPNFAFCPGDNVQHLCYAAPSQGARYVAQGPRYAVPDCPFLCTSPLHVVAANGTRCAFPDVGTFPVDGSSSSAPCTSPAVFAAESNSVLQLLGVPLRWTSSGLRGDNSSCSPELLYQVAAPSGSRATVANALCASGFTLRATVAAALPATNSSTWTGLVSVGVSAIASQQLGGSPPLVEEGAHLLLTTSPQGHLLRLVVPGMHPAASLMSDPLPSSLATGTSFAVAASVDHRTQLVSFFAGIAASQLTLIGTPAPFRGMDFQAGRFCSPATPSEVSALVAGGWMGWLATPQGDVLRVGRLAGSIFGFAVGAGPMLRTDLEEPGLRWRARATAQVPDPAASRCAWGFYWSTGSLGSAAACRQCPVGFAGSSAPRTSLGDCLCPSGYVRETLQSADCLPALPAASPPTVAVNFTSQVTLDDIPSGLRLRTDWLHAVQGDTGSSSHHHIAIRASTLPASDGLVVISAPEDEQMIVGVNTSVACSSDHEPLVVALWLSTLNTTHHSLRTANATELPAEPVLCLVSARTVGTWRRGQHTLRVVLSVGILPDALPLLHRQLVPVPGTAAYLESTAVAVNDTTKLTAAPLATRDGLWLVAANYLVHPSIGRLLAAGQVDAVRDWELTTVSRLINTTRIEVSAVVVSDADAVDGVLATATANANVINQPHWQVAMPLLGLPQQFLPYEPGVAAVVCSIRVSAPTALIPSPRLLVVYYHYNPNTPRPTSTTPDLNSTNPPTSSGSSPPSATTPSTAAPSVQGENATATATSVSPAVAFFASPVTIGLAAALCCILALVLLGSCYRRRRRTMRRLRLGARDHHAEHAHASPIEDAPDSSPAWFDHSGPPPARHDHHRDRFDPVAGGTSRGSRSRPRALSLSAGQSPHDPDVTHPSPFCTVRKRRVSMTPPPTHRAIASSGRSPFAEMPPSWDAAAKLGSNAAASRSTSPRRLLEAASRAEPPTQFRDYGALSAAVSHHSQATSSSVSRAGKTHHHTGHHTGHGSPPHMAGMVHSPSHSVQHHEPFMPSTGPPHPMPAGLHTVSTSDGRTDRGMSPAPVDPRSALRPPSPRLSHRERLLRRLEEVRPESIHIAHDDPSHPAASRFSTAASPRTQRPHDHPASPSRGGAQDFGSLWQGSPQAAASSRHPQGESDGALWGESDLADASRRAVPSRSPRQSPTASVSSRGRPRPEY